MSNQNWRPAIPAKGGQNLTYQITERPPDPPPMRPASAVPQCTHCGLRATASGSEFCGFECYFAREEKRSGGTP